MAISFIAGSAQFLTGSASTIATPTTLNVTTGDTIVVNVRIGNTTFPNLVTGVTDTAGNIYRLAAVIVSANGIPQNVWYCTNCVANAANTITATYNGATVNRAIAAAQFRGLATISPLDVCVVGQTSAANITSPTFTTAVANSIAVSVSEIDSTTSTWTVGAGYTEAIRDASNVQLIQYQIFGSIQTGVTATANNNTAVAKTIVVITLHETIVSGGGGEQSHTF